MVLVIEMPDCCIAACKILANVSLSASNLDWLANMDSLKESLRLASNADSLRLSDVDISQYQGMSSTTTTEL